MNNFPFGNAKWICCREFVNETPVNIYARESDKLDTDCPDELKNLHIEMYSSFETDNISGEETIRITADDYYFLYINGQFVCQGPTQGYHFLYRYNEVNISAFLKKGKNDIRVCVYYHGMICRAYVSGDRRQGLICVIKDGEKTLAVTDKNWHYRYDRRDISKDTIGYATLFSEKKDMRIPLSEEYDAGEKAVDHSFCDAPDKPLQVYFRKPSYSEELSNGALFYDMGQEITGTVHFTFSGEAGKKIRILIGEETDDNEYKTRYDMRCSCICDEYVITNGETAVYDQFDYRGFRYFTLVPEDGIEITDVSVRVRHNSFDDDYCVLETDDKVLEAVWTICKNGVKYGSQEIYVDCPTREKGQYTGDMTVTGAAQMILTGDGSMMKKALDELMASARITKALMAVAPSGYNQEIADYSLQFPLSALRYYKLSGDKEYLKKNLEVCEDMLRHFEKYTREDGLLYNYSEQWNLVDWPVNLRDDYAFDLDDLSSGVHNVINAFYVGAVKGMEEIKDILGIPHDGKSKKLTASFNKAFFDNETGLYTDGENIKHSSLHANALPLFYGLAEKENERHICDFLVGKGLVCGVYMTFFMLKGLCRAGRYEDAYNIITSTGENSWYNMVREGGTCCFEAWGKDKKWNTSLCHPWASAPVTVLYEDILPVLKDKGRIIKNEVHI